MKKTKANKVTTGPDKKKNDNSTTLSIQSYFKSAPKLHQSGKNDKSSDIDETKAVYVEILKKRIHELDNASEPVERESFDNNLEVGASSSVRESFNNEVEHMGTSSPLVEKRIIDSAKAMPTGDGADQFDQHWENKYKNLEKEYHAHITACKDWENKYKSLKKDYMKLGTNFAELRMQHDDLLSTKTYVNISPDTADVTAASVIFTSSETEVLQNMPLDQKTDSTFILACLKFAYKTDLSALRHRTLKGTAEAMVVSKDGDVAFMPGKDPMSPQKIDPIRALFIQRIKKCKLKPAEFAQRIKDTYMNKLVASAITNIGKTTKMNK